MPVMEIRYGSAFERSVRLEYGLRDVHTDKEPREQSEWLRSPTGAEDAASFGYDYVMEAVAQYVPTYDKDLANATPIAGAESWRSFTDWARDKKQFRLLPNATFPQFYVDSCVLDSPKRGLGVNRTPSERDVAFKVRNPSVDFGQALRGIVFEITPEDCLADGPGDPNLFSSFRSTTALYLKEDGSVGDAALHELRDRHYEGGARGILIESKAINLIENGDYETDAVGTSGNAAPTLTRDATNVRHGSWALKVSYPNTSGAGPYWLRRAGTRIVAVAARNYAMTVDVYCPTASVGKQIRLALEWWDSTPAQLGGTVNGPTVTLVAGWQRLSLVGASVASTAFVTPTLYTTSAQGTFDVWVDLACLIERSYVMQPIPTNTGQATREGDRYERRNLRLSMAMDWTIYLELWPQHGNLTSWPDTEPNADPCILWFGPSSVNPDQDPNNAKVLRLHRQNGGASYEWEYAPNTPTASRTFTPSTNVQKLTLRHYASDHHLDLAIDGSAFSASPAPAIQQWEPLTLLRFFGIGFTEPAGDAAFRRVKCAIGLKTQAQMEAL